MLFRGLVIRGASLALLAGCAAQSPATPKPGDIALRRVFVSDPSKAGCFAGSPRIVRSRGEDGVLVADDRLRVLDPRSGKELWTATLPVDESDQAEIIATPVSVSSSRVVVAWQDVDRRTSERVRHRAAVVDLETRAVDPTYPVVTFAATKQTSAGAVDFLPGHALSRSELVHAVPEGEREGRVYVSFGNARDLQPWHGWLFEVSLDAWREKGAAAAISSVLLTTEDPDCGPEGGDGARMRECGGGIWAPTGPLLHPVGNSFELWVPTGNGALDPLHGQYAHTIMRVGPGLTFSSGCDLSLCEQWNVDAPEPRCLASCENLFIPRFADGKSFSALGVCEGKSFFGCYQALDWDLGANSPIALKLPSGQELAILPGKDGGVYLFDARNFGTLYDRVQITSVCGSEGASCQADWAGMIVAQPTLAQLGDETVVLVPTFMPDSVHPAGLVALKVALVDNAPKLSVMWRSPSDGDEARQAFRWHPSNVALIDANGETLAAVVDAKITSSSGALYLFRVRDGAVVSKAALASAGRRFIRPLVRGSQLYVTSCTREGTVLESYELTVGEKE